jgi:hypothetical protein
MASGEGEGKDRPIPIPSMSGDKHAPVVDEAAEGEALLLAQREGSGEVHLDVQPHHRRPVPQPGKCWTVWVMCDGWMWT